jgi:hypothetical protein
LIAWFTQTGLLLPTVIVGKGFTVTVVTALPWQPFASVAVTLYVPLMAGVAGDNTGF